MINVPNQDGLWSPLVLFVEDDRVLRDQLVTLARRSGFQAVESDNVDEAVELASRLRPACIVSDLKMPGAQGSQIPGRLRALGLEIPIAILTGEAGPEQLSHLREGGMECLVKPISPQTLIALLTRLAGPVVPEGSVVGRDEGGVGIVGRSLVMQRLVAQIDRIGRTRATVLLEGPSGSGKELIARALHQRQRSPGLFVGLNCAAIPDGLADATLFGHERGAFTGAIRSARGVFEQAQGGTLLLDEVSEMRLDLQAKLLRVLQERSFQRIGGESAVPVEARIIAATNCDLHAAIERGEFREDLYYRLDVIHVHVPSLAERREDIPLLVNHLLTRLAAHHGLVPPTVTSDALALLSEMDWPGNVRQLATCIERILLSIDRAVIDVDDVAAHGPRPRGPASRSPGSTSEPAAHIGDAWVRRLESINLDTVCLTVMREALRRTRGNRRLAAQLLGIHVRTLRRNLAGAPTESPR